MTSEYFTLDMEDSKLKDTIFTCGLKTEAEVELMTKSEMVNALNENCKKELKFRIIYPEIPESIDLKNNLDVTYTPCIPLKTITSPKNGTSIINTSSINNNNKSTENDNNLPSLEKDPSITYTSSSGSSGNFLET